MNVQALNTSLQRVSNESGKEFVLLSDSFPILIQELNFSDSSSSSQAASGLREFNRIQQQLLDTVQSQYDMQNNNNAFLDEFQRRNRELLENFSKRMEFLNKMNELILQIKDESMEMEIISLNAMIVSIKSGKQGQAFSYITSNLKRLSFQLISQSELLISHEKNVQKSIVELKKTIDAGETLSKTAHSMKNTAGERVAQTVRGIAQALPAIIELAESVKQPIVKAMECVQMQDIIRQSLDDVLFTIGHIGELSDESGLEGRLDQYFFNEKLTTLSIQLLDSITAKLLDSTRIFTENHGSVNKILADVESCRMDFIKKHSSQNIGSINLHKNVEEVGDEINEFMRIILSYQNSQQRVMLQSQAIQNEVLKMQSCFAEFFPIIDNLQYVAVAQRIEVARNDAISSIHSTVEYMSDLIVQTNRNVQNAQEQLQLFIDNSTRDISKFTSSSAQDKKYFTALEEEKTRVLSSFDRLLDECIEKIRSFTVYSPNFYENYEKISSVIQRLELLALDIRGVQEALQQILAYTQERKNKLLTEAKITDWDIKNDRFNEIIHHFTIVSDKQTAGNVGGFQVEGGAESGDITFF